MDIHVHERRVITIEQGFSVTLLNGFSLKLNGESVEMSRGMESRAAILLQYLLYHHKSKLSTEDIYSSIFSLQDSTDPPHLVRINIHRLKKMLKETALPDEEYILKDGRLYYWTDNIPCVTDVQLFLEAATATLQETEDTQKRIEECRKALNLYKGELLPNRGDVRWVAVERVKLKRLYVRCLEFFASQFSSEEGLVEVLEYCDRGVQIYPYDEELHILKMRCLFELRRFSEAIQAFNTANNAIYSQLGVPPSKKLLSMFSDLSRNKLAFKSDIEDIKCNLKEDVVSESYHINFASFMEAYRIIARIVERTGQSVFLMLIELDMDESQHDERSREATEALHRAIQQSQRKGDIFTRYSYTQFLLLLLGINEENCQLVFQRIKNAWRKEWNGRGIQISYRAVSSIEVEASDCDCKWD